MHGIIRQMDAPPAAPCEAPITPLIDTHAHLSDRRFHGDVPAVLARARAAGLIAMMIVGYDLDSSRRAVQLAERSDDLWAVIGVHPHHADDFSTAAGTELRALAASDKVMAIGECGLDYYRNLASSEAQRKAFASQLDLAAELGLPIVIHSREAMEETLATLAGVQGLVERGGVLHCFDGTAEDARQAVLLGLHVSCAGPITYRKDPTLAQAIAQVPPDRLVVETDCPYLSPAGHRGERNEPAHVRLVAEAVARVRSRSIADTARETSVAAAALFRLPLAPSLAPGKAA